MTLSLLSLEKPWPQKGYEQRTGISQIRKKNDGVTTRYQIFYKAGENGRWRVSPLPLYDHLIEARIAADSYRVHKGK